MKLDKNIVKLQENQVLHTFENSDQVYYHNRGIYIEFRGKRRVLSTSVLNGGISEELQGVFNFNCLADQYECRLTEDTYEKELAYNAKQIGLYAQKVTGLSTAAWMEHLSIQKETFEGLQVTAIVTGGVDKNAVRVGDLASYYEKDGVFHMINSKEKVSHGTINIILYINKNLAPGVLTRALVTCSEAKVVALQEMMIGSLYSDGIATGSGTDGTIIISDSCSLESLTDASEHSKLGELIGKTVKNAVKEALYLQTGACGPRQHKLTERGKRYGITLGSLWSCYMKDQKEFDSLSGTTFSSLCEFEECLAYRDSDSNPVVWLSLYLHLLDQYKWGLLEWGEVVRETEQLTKSLLWIEENRLIRWIFMINFKQDVETELIERAKRSIIVLLLLANK